MRVLSLRSTLLAYLGLTALATFVLVGGVSVLGLARQVADEDQQRLASDAADLVLRTEMLLGGVERPLALLARTLDGATPSARAALLDAAADSQPAFGLIYLVSAEGRVQAIGRSGAGPRDGLAELLGMDLSGNPMLQLAHRRAGRTWSDQYLSALSGRATIALAIPVGQGLLIGEVPPSYLIEALRAAVGPLEAQVWLVDGSGEVLADNRGRPGTNLATMPLVRAALDRRPLPETFVYEGRRYRAAVAHSDALDWTFVARLPDGIDNPHVRSVVAISLVAAGAALLLGALIAPVWAAAMGRTVNALVQRAREVARGLPMRDWPRGRVRELNLLAGDLETMAVSLREREQRFRVLFEASPVGVALVGPEPPHRIVDLNDHMAALIGRPREDCLGQGDEPLWPNPATRADWWNALAGGSADAEVTLRRADGEGFECRLLGRPVRLGEQRLVVWVCEDQSETRALARQLAALNAGLEERVARRTQDLAAANERLSRTVAQLEQTRDDLVRSEKLAALGGLVAGIAHELNTPIGNALMAVTTLQDEAHAQPAGQPPDEAFTQRVARGMDIAHRNLAKAAELVTSFKQVAVDQTSAQRRSFLVDEVVDELRITLTPTLRRSPVRLVTSIAPGLRMDSYPGALSQTLANLIGNALQHAFEPGQVGEVVVRAEAESPGWVRLQVQDNGAGIPPALHQRIFEPFFTTRMGRGGTGLGLHIVHNAVENVLGGRITLDSQPGRGCLFTISLPQTAPQPVPAPGNDAAGRDQADHSGRDDAAPEGRAA